MGARLVKFYFCPGENEQLETTVRICEEKRSVIHGVVKDWNDCIVKDAVVTLYEVIEKGDNSELLSITHTFTDDHGQFLFGPLCPHKKYLIKVWFNISNIKELDIKPDCHSEECLNGKCDKRMDSLFKTITTNAQDD